MSGGITSGGITSGAVVSGGVVSGAVVSGAAGGAGSGVVSAPEVLLEVRGLCVDYGLGDDAVHAVVGADLDLRRGEVLGLAGESGSGKSTLAYAVTRLLRPPGVITAGSARFGESVDLLSAGQRELRGLRWNEIAVVLQSSMNALNPVLSIGTQFSDVLRAHRPDMSRAAGRPVRASCSRWWASPPTGWVATHTSCPAACASG